MLQPDAGAPRKPLAAALASLDTALVVALTALAALIRFPDFLYLPVFTDETWDAVRSLAIAEGRLQTLVNSSVYISSLQNYLTAGLFLLLGPQIVVPRLLVLVVGCLTIPAAYLLGRELGGRTGGLVAAALLATNPVHVLVNSHVGWSNSLTPLFTTLALWQISRAVRRLDGGALVWAGGLLALALLTHPAAVLVLPACALLVAWRAPGLLRSRWPWLAAGAFLLVYSPLVLHNLLGLSSPADLTERLRGSHPIGRAIETSGLTGLESVDFAEQVRRQHADGRPLSPALYLENLVDFSLLLLRSASGAAEIQEQVADYLLDPGVLLWAALLLGVPIVLARRREWLVALVLLCSLLLAPLWSLNSFEPVTNGRFMVPAVIALYAGLGALIAAHAPRRPGLRVGLPLVATAALALLQLLELGRYYDSRPADNRAAIDALERVEAERRPEEAVLLDRRLNDRRLGYGAVQLNRVFEMLFLIRDIPFAPIDGEPEELQRILAQGPTQLAILDRASLPRLSERFNLTQLAIIRPRQSRAERQRDVVPAWRDAPLAALLRQLDPQGRPERRDARDCPDCPDPGLFRIARRG